MPSEILVDLTTASASGNAPGSWGTVSGLSASDITVQGTDSVLLIMMSIQLNAETDHTAEFRLLVNGVATDSPNNTQFIDEALDGGTGTTLVWAIDGLSGSSNTFVVQWQTVVGTSSASTNHDRMLQVVEISGGDAEIIVNMTGTSTEADPPSWGDLFTSGSVGVDGTGSILIMIGSVPYNMEADERSEFRFAIDSTEEGAVTTVYTDNANEGNGWSGVHCLNGLSAGTHTFHLEWQAVSGAGQTDTGGKTRTFQVVEIKANATLQVDAESIGAGTSSGSFATVTGLTGSYIPQSSNSINLMFSNMQITQASDNNVNVSLAVDSTNTGGLLTNFTDSTVLTQRMLLAYAVTGYSTNKTFSTAWQTNNVQATLDESRARTMFVIELVQESYVLSGVTKDNDGDPLGEVDCYLCKDVSSGIPSFLNYTLSQAGTGNYHFSGIANVPDYFVIAHQSGIPSVFDITDHILSGIPG